MRKHIYDRLVSDVESSRTLRRLLKAAQKPYRDLSRRQKRETDDVKVIYKGNYYRLKRKPDAEPIKEVSRLPAPNPLPKAFKHPPPPADTVASKVVKEPEPEYQRLLKRSYAWLVVNLPIIALNFGSICTLVGFTRSDVLELRAMSMIGSLTAVFFNLTRIPTLWPNVFWSSLFAAVNGVKIFQIMQERNAHFSMTDEQENLYVEHFMPHGVTPKQFERIEKKATVLKLKKGELLIRNGEKLDHVYLVIEGSTQAHVLGRHLTAASTTPNTKGNQKEGGDSGAWVGEIAFLDQFWENESNRARAAKPAANTVDKAPGNDANQEVDSILPEQKRKAREVAIYTIVAKEDCTVLQWSQEDMEELMHSSTDLRASMTRAMTSALVGKVVNLTISKASNALPHWSTWLSDWKHNDGAVRVSGSRKLPEDNRRNTEPKEALVAAS